MPDAVVAAAAAAVVAVVVAVFEFVSEIGRIKGHISLWLFENPCVFVFYSVI